jgi:hypothetical protein
MNRVMGFLTFAMLVGMAIILMLNFSALLTPPKNERYLSYNGVRGMAVEHNRLLWTLNFEQQNQVIDFLNRCLPIGKNTSHLEKRPLSIDRLVIYRFNAPDLFVTPVGYDGDNLIFQAQEWNPSGYLLDVSGGLFNTLLTQTYD